MGGVNLIRRFAS